MYCIDTSALIDGWVDHYPPAVFPALWQRIDRLIAAGGVVASKTVYHEIEDRDDRLIDWADSHPEMFIEDDDQIQQWVRRFFAEWPYPVDFTRFMTGADPFVIAHAQQRGVIVVTAERQVRSLNAPRIPDVCAHYGITWMSLLGMIQREGWQF